MNRPLARNGLINSLALALAAVAMWLLSSAAASATGELAAALVGVGFLTAGIAWFQMRLELREETERHEMADLARSRSQTSMFDSAAPETFPARRAREQFERYLVPAFTLLLFLLEAFAVVWFYRRLTLAEQPTKLEPLSGFLFGGIGLVLFLLGRYSARLAQLESAPLLRPSAAAVILGALLAFVSALIEGLDYFGVPQYDRYVAWVLVAGLAVVALETLFALIFEAYRPRQAGKPARLIYESRLMGLLGQPTGIFTTLAQAVDYQFGFNVSETWFYQFLQQNVLKLLLVQVGLIWLATTIVVIDPGEQGLKERFGRPVGLVEPGIHFKWPYPVDDIRRYNTRLLQSLNVGFLPDHELERDDTIVWTKSHYREEVNFLVASRDQASGNTNQVDAVPVNLLTVSIPVLFIVKDLRQWGYEHSDPAWILERLAYREVVQRLASVDMETVMSFGRAEMAGKLKTAIQKSADAAKLGVEIVFVGLQDIHPPLGTKEIAVAAAYEKLIGAEQDRETIILTAQGEAGRNVLTAEGESARMTNSAIATAAARESDAAGRAGQFGSQLAAYRAAPAVYKTHAQVETFTKAVADARKYIVVPDQLRSVVTLNLEDKLRKDILDAALINPEGRTNSAGK